MFIHFFQGNIFTVTAVAMVSCTFGFLLPNDCHVAPKCACLVNISGDTFDNPPMVGVFCGNRNFLRIPTFQNVSYKMTQPWTIDFEFNFISSLPDNAFSNLQAYGNSNNVSVLLRANALKNENISDSAFSGLENYIVFLSLSANWLTYIPSFVSRLTHLETLNVEKNPLTYIDPSIFISIGRTLKTLTIDTYSRRPLQIPSVVCKLNHLESLDVTIGLAHAQRLSGDNMINCTMNSTTSLTIRKYSYYRFPDVLQSFPNIEDISVGGEVQYIDDSLIPARSRVKKLSMLFNKLQTIPGAINLFSLLEYVALSYNDIKTVERHSFDNLQHLEFIELVHNPIIYISRFAFRNLVALKTLNMAGTKLISIPQAFETLPNLDMLVLGSNITCTCQPWMKQWSLSIKGRMKYLGGGCQTPNESVYNFVYNTVPNCA